MSFLEEAKALYGSIGDAGPRDETEEIEGKSMEKKLQPQSSRRSTLHGRRRGASASTTAAASTFTLLLPLAGGLWLWRWWQRRQKQRENKGNTVTGKQQNRSHRSTFSFDNQSKKGKKAGSGKDSGLSSESPIQAIPTVKASAPPPNLSGPGPRVTGNPKKNHKRKTAKKEAKAASKQGGKDNDAAASIIAARAKEKGIADAGKTPETGFYSVVDVEKNTDAFHNVQQWQETGKKAYKR
ncbi:hypothetical protein DUNSADRAFT_15809 [Dunaliella salina]|uniref:Uncharacterized protein n=1 Tax=Dunaliella salina TaxID=3046 RepID=A0ABQ7H1H8_DUNSA|nr:hypothetical protein DUNSADRAFT_15809 [Dunaliella salina]|eukprot:KAF5840714.1 hypothetical protein DUNSADRAFT_15809 [Dunaliella salina]